VSEDALRAGIEARSARLGVIGLGYVGVPVACAFASAGFDVTGVDIDASKVAKLNRALLPIAGAEPDLAGLLRDGVEAESLRATTDYEALGDREVLFICVETPVDSRHRPDYTALRSALNMLGPVIPPGALVIVESTLAPGTMDTVVRPLLESASGYRTNETLFLGTCPERVMPGQLLEKLRTKPRVIGGASLETAKTMALLYRCVVQGELDCTDCLTAETVKTVENAYRDVQIAFANEIAFACEALGCDAWTVRDLVNRNPNRQMHLPGGGVGGHCIPKDPWLLVSATRDRGFPLTLLPVARAINDAMPLHVASLLREALKHAGREPAGSRVLVMGYSYLENTGDTRNTPSQSLVNHLTDWGCDVMVFDPHVPEYRENLNASNGKFDALVYMVKHDGFVDASASFLKSLLNEPIVIDARQVLDGNALRRAGIRYYAVGKPRRA